MQFSWLQLPRPFLVLAPLEGVTDTVFRRIVASCAKPDVFVTEFTSADGFCSKGHDIVAQNFLYTKEEEPIVAQLWGKNPNTMEETAEAIAGMGFAGIDINMGCPDRTVMSHGCGAAMIDTPEVAAEVIAAVKRGVAKSGKNLPVSVKTRLGNKKITTDTWMTFLLSQGLAALVVHGRTAAELSRVPAHWDEIAKVVALRDKMKVSTIIIGNGDVRDAADANEKHMQYGVDGVMIGRGIFTNLWAFDRTLPPHVGSPLELLEVMERHIRLFRDTWGDTKQYPILKKFFKIYINGFYGATDARVEFMATNSYEEALPLLEKLKNAVALLYTS